MRIRKRFPPSSLSSDPHLTPSPPLVQLQTPTNPQPSDPPNLPLPNQQVMIGTEKTRWVHHEHKLQDLDGEEVKDERPSEEEKNNHIIRKSSSLGQDSSTHQILPQANSHQVIERWFEGDHKVFPLKKRIVREEINTEDKDKKMMGKMKMKSKTNKKCAKVYSEDQEEEGSERSKTKSKSQSSDNKRGSEIMEGSRCSRVNGRGWRCGQQTLVGYSLCEHHLGKGRLRSMASVRSRALVNTRVAPKKFVPEPESESEELLDDVHDDLDDDDDDDDDDHGGGALMVRKKRMRLGVVKARSIRSLLGQTDSGVHVVADDDNKNRS
ncbi:hypothetical protein LguiA_024680 [Lonicera macranthoides]